MGASTERVVHCQYYISIVLSVCCTKIIQIEIACIIAEEKIRMSINQKSNDFDCFTIRFSLSSVLDDDIENYSTLIKGEMVNIDDYDDVKNQIGAIQGYYVDIENSWKDGYEPFDILDLDGSTAAYYDVLYDFDTKEFKEDLGSDIIYSNLLIIDRLEIKPAYRNRKIGLSAMFRMIQQFSHGCGLVAIKVFPLQFEAKRENKESEQWFVDMDLESFEQEETPAFKKLKTYYQQLGFVEVDNSHVMVLNPSYKQPSLNDIGAGDSLD